MINAIIFTSLVCGFLVSYAVKVYLDEKRSTRELRVIVVVVVEQESNDGAPSGQRLE